MIYSSAGEGDKLTSFPSCADKSCTEEDLSSIFRLGLILLESVATSHDVFVHGSTIISGISKRKIFASVFSEYEIEMFSQRHDVAETM